MTSRAPLVVGAAIGLGGLILGLIAGQPSVGQGPASPPKVPGRYQVAIGGPAPTVAVIDSATGECWSLSPGASDWRPLGAPHPVDR